MTGLNSILDAVAKTMATGTTPDKPADPYVPAFHVGTIQAVSSTKCTVRFPGPVDIPNLAFLLTGRTLVVGDIVLVLQTPHQRIVLAAISH